MTSLRTFAAFCGVDNLLVGYKMPPIGQHIPHPLPGLNRDLTAMLDLCKTEEQSAMIGLLGLMGLRLFEALSLRPSDFNIPTMTLKVWGKANKVRELPITDRAWRYIGPRYLTALVKKMPTVLAYSDRGARNFITELGVKAHVSRPISSHDLRATFATLVYAKTLDILALQIWLGHDSIETTQMYVAVAKEALRAAGDI